MWTRFMDMHSGGTQKQKWDRIFIEAPEADAKVIFYNRFGRSPDKVTCTCCGEDYSTSSESSLEQITAFDRNCAFAFFDAEGREVSREAAWVPGKGHLPGCSSRYVERKGEWGEYITLSDYLTYSNVLFIPASDIKPEEREGSVPQQGYVWVD